jgi:hypothetical protein
MSTKTTFKRIALVAVASLGFGMLSTGATNAATVAIGATTGFSTDVSSITLVAAGAPANTEYGVFEVSLTNASGIAAPLQSNETLSATIIATPAPLRTGLDGSGVGATLVGDVTANWATDYDPVTRTAATAASATLAGSAGANALAQAYNDLDQSSALRGGIAVAAGSYTSSTSTTTATYALKVSTADADALNAGFYTIRIRVLDSGSNTISSKDVKFQVVSSKANSGAVLTAAVTGSHPTVATTGAAVALTPTQNITATLADVNGGRIVELTNATPALTASVKDKGTTATSTVPSTYITDVMTFTDTGTAYTAALDTAGVTVATVIGDGTYEVTTGLLKGLAGTGTLTVRYGDASATASIVMTGTTASTWMNTSVSATGKVANSTDFDLPLTTKAATVTATAYNAADITAATTTAVGATVMYYTVSYSGCVLGDMLPAAVSTATKVTADANGQYAVAITNANPISGCSATVVFSGATLATTVSSTTTASLTRVINWTAPVATSVVVSPAGNYEAVPGSTHKFTWTITDQFSAPVVGSTVQFSMSGANKPAVGSSVPSAITDANGQVSYTFTDAAGVPASTTLGTTSVGLTSVGITPFVKGTRTITYKASITAIASLYATYTTTNAAATPVTLTGVVPTTAIGGVTGVLTSDADLLDTTKVVTGTSARPWVKLNFTAKTAAGVATSGVPTTVTVTGAKLIGSDGKLGTTVTLYANDDVYVLGTTTGVATVTATNGTLTSTATINFVNAATDARVLKLTEAAGLVTASVTDAFGNAVKGVAVDVVGSGGAWLGNGSTSAAFNTATDGTVTFSVTGAGTITASLASTYTKASNLADAGNSTGTVITTGAPAGVRSASVATTGNNVTSDAAQAASDAAAEATDAANAATDAANAAAEAADAATAAAQDAADAVAALSTQVATYISNLRKQITALTNLVIKIQKKVNA